METLIYICILQHIVRVKNHIIEALHQVKTPFLINSKKTRIQNPRVGSEEDEIIYIRNKMERRRSRRRRRCEPGPGLGLRPARARARRLGAAWARDLESEIHLIRIPPPRSVRPGPGPGLGPSLASGAEEPQGGRTAGNCA